MTNTHVTIRDRIKDFRRVPASELRPSPHNWRVHNEAQRDALRGVLAEIGYADALVARELEDGGLELIDGHLRAEETPDEMVPVLVLDVDADEAATLIATLDPIGAMADANQTILDDLLQGLRPNDANVRELLDELARGIPVEDTADEGQTTLRELNEMNLRPHEHYDYVVVLARTVQEWNQLAELLGMEKMLLEPSGKIGYGRGIPAAKLIDLIKHTEELPKGQPKKQSKKSRPDSGRKR